MGVSGQTSGPFVEPGQRDLFLSYNSANRDAVMSIRRALSVRVERAKPPIFAPLPAKGSSPTPPSCGSIPFKILPRSFELAADRPGWRDLLILPFRYSLAREVAA
jgi:hypothetical protein